MKRNGVHRHRCPECRTIWQHPHECGHSSGIALRRCHTCPMCGYHRRYGKGTTYLWYTGRRKPVFKYNAPHGARESSPRRAR